MAIRFSTFLILVSLDEVGNLSALDRMVNTYIVCGLRTVDLHYRVSRMALVSRTA